jgi:hypothetical protein
MPPDFHAELIGEWSLCHHHYERSTAVIMHWLWDG